MELEDPSKPWFDQPKSKARGYNLMEPYDRIFVGCDPKDGMTKADADSFDVFINVSCSECATFQPSRPGQFHHWYPINELGLWNLSYLFWLKKVLDFHFKAGHRIYLHCHAGAYRSPSAALLWLQSRGYSPETALSFANENEKGHIYRIWADHENIPKLKDRLFEVMREHPTYSLAGVLYALEGRNSWNKEIISGDCRKRSLLHYYFWFYYRPKYWLKSKWSDFKHWAFDRYGWVREGAGTWLYKRKDFWAWPQNAEPMDPTTTVDWPKRMWNAERKAFELVVNPALTPEEKL